MQVRQETGPSAGSPSEAEGGSRSGNSQSNDNQAGPERLLTSVPRFAVEIDRSPATVFRLIRAGHLKTVRVGGHQMVTAAEKAAFIARAERGELALNQSEK